MTGFNQCLERDSVSDCSFYPGEKAECGDQD